MVVRIYGWVFVGVTGSGMKEKNLVIKVTLHKGDSYQSFVVLASSANNNVLVLVE